MRYVITLFIYLLTCIQAYCEPLQNKKWPEIKLYKELAVKSAKTYREKRYDYKNYLTCELYDPFGDFLNWGKYHNWYDRLPKDPNGIVTSKDNTYNPCTIAQFALQQYGKYLLKTGSKKAFLHTADFLISMIEDDGSVRYYFDYPYYCYSDKYFKSGWCSAMDSGHVLSICARAYHVTGNKKYCEAAKKVLNFLTIPIADDGVMGTLEWLDPSLKDYIIYEEYPTIPSTYTLNGFMYTLIGLYDWSCVDSETKEKSMSLFQKGIITLEKILPYYDIGGFTAYDLSHITLKTDKPHIGLSYHREHTFFCKIFFDITKKDVFNKYYKLWASYVDN